MRRFVEVHVAGRLGRVSRAAFSDLHVRASPEQSVLRWIVPAGTDPLRLLWALEHHGIETTQIRITPGPGDPPM